MSRGRMFGYVYFATALVVGLATTQAKPAFADTNQFAFRPYASTQQAPDSDCMGKLYRIDTQTGKVTEIDCGSLGGGKIVSCADHSQCH